jgi:aldehyde dehydrogenase (NAD+)
MREGKIKKESIAQIVNAGNFARVKGWSTMQLPRAHGVAGGELDESDLTVHPTMLTGSRRR